MPERVLETLSVKSIDEFVALVDRMQREHEKPLWYRGCCRSGYKLVPALYRHPGTKQAEELDALEKEILLRFRQQSMPYLPRMKRENTNYLFLMQHYGVPTRLLDWSENPFVGLYFALSKVVHPIEKYDTSVSSAVWILDPTSWNQHLLERISYPGGVLSADDQLVSSYLPDSDIAHRNSYPIAIYGDYNSPRIAAQKGVFTLFGKEVAPMEEMAATGRFPAACLRKIEIAGNVVVNIYRSLVAFGLTSAVVFPDLDGLAKDFRWTYGFEG